MSVPGDREIAAASTIAEILAIHARRNPTAPAILAPDRPTLAYGALATFVDCTVQALASAGVGRGERVAVALPNGSEAATLTLSVLCAAVCVPVNPVFWRTLCEALLPSLRVDALIAPEDIVKAVGMDVRP